MLVLDFMSISTLGRCFYIYVYNPKREKRKEGAESSDERCDIVVMGGLWAME